LGVFYHTKPLLFLILCGFLKILRKKAAGLEKSLAIAGLI